MNEGRGTNHFSAQTLVLKPARITLSLPDGSSYDVRIGCGILNNLGARMRSVPACSEASQVVVISDAHVMPLYGKRTVQSLREAGFVVHSISIEAGESSKSIEVVTELWAALAYFGMQRSDCVVALGGGVVCDVVGFAASTYMRGIPVVHVPTSLLAMVDASVGGKTALNLPGADNLPGGLPGADGEAVSLPSAGVKNLIGTFHQPSYVHADVDVLATLPQRELTCGWAELAKTALLCEDVFYFDALEAAQSGAASVEALSSAELRACMQDMVVRAVAFKAGVVSADPRDATGARACLNLGHTYGHALEAISGLGVLPHGACVAEGIRFAARLAQALCGASAEFTQAQDELLDAIGCPRITCAVEPEGVLRAMKRDKKAREGQVQFVLLRDVGDWMVQATDDEFLLKALAAWNAL